MHFVSVGSTANMKDEYAGSESDEENFFDNDESGGNEDDLEMLNDIL